MQQLRGLQTSTSGYTHISIVPLAFLLPTLHCACTALWYCHCLTCLTRQACLYASRHLLMHNYLALTLLTLQYCSPL
jgi:hypothetical protein